MKTMKVLSFIIVIAERLFAKLTALIWKISHSNLDFLEFIAQFVSVCKII